MDRISRPELTLPEAEAATLGAAYERANVILEYGSGGSTVMAGALPGKQVFAVENDKAWALMMREWFAQNPPNGGTAVDIIWNDTGETKAWGYPKDTAHYLRYPQYALKVWELDEFRQPDVVFVDGRFRTGCILACALRTGRPVRVFVDDYLDRETYRAVEVFVGAPRMHGRMAEFSVEPMALEAEHLLDVIDMMIRP
ncbi:MAG: hypothetical protein AAFO72_04295 [Pseudomonadota bacterium]